MHHSPEALINQEEEGLPTVNVTTRCFAEQTISPAITNTVTANRQFSRIFIIKNNLLLLFEATEHQARNQYEYGKFIKGERSE